MIAVEQSVGLILKKQDVPTSVVVSWHFGTGSDPRILTTELRIRMWLRTRILLFSSGA